MLRGLVSAWDDLFRCLPSVRLGPLIQNLPECFELLLLVLISQPLEQVHQVLIAELLVEVCTQVPYTPHALQICQWNWFVLSLL